jgi:hypothetical protein
MPDNTIDADAVELVIRKLGLRFNLIGIALWVSPLIYAIVLACILLTRANGPSETYYPETDNDFLVQLAGILAGLSVIIIPTTFWLKAFLRKYNILGKPEESITRRSGNPFAELQREHPETSQAVAKTIQYLQISLITTMVAESPAIFALVLSLFQLFQGPGLFANTPVFAMIVFMWMEALIVTWYTIPRVSRLRQQLADCTADASTEAAALEEFA